VGGMKFASSVPDPPAVHVCASRPNSILEMALHGMPTEALEILLEARSNDVEGRPPGPSLTTVHFLTPTSRHPSVLTLVMAADRLSVARFTAAWAGTTGPLPSDDQIGHWNHAADTGRMHRDAEGEVVVRFEVDLKRMTLQQVIPVWLDWDRCVSHACALVASVRSGVR
jgi:hypothetical protein